MRLLPFLADGSVVTWGEVPAIGGDSSGVQDQLKDVQQIQASSRAFAAILGDGSVVTWGDACRWRCSASGVQGQVGRTCNTFKPISQCLCCHSW